MPKSFQKPHLEADEVLPSSRVSGFFDPDGNPYPLPQIKILRDWGYRIPMESFKEWETVESIEKGKWDVGKDNKIVPKGVPISAKRLELKEQAKELGMNLSGKPQPKEPDRDEYMTTREWQSAFGQHQHEWKRLPEPRPHFMNWFMDNHGDLFSYYLMKPIFTSPYNKDALDAMKVFIQYSKQLPKSKVVVETVAEDSETPEELVSILYKMLPAEQIVGAGLQSMGCTLQDFKDFVSSKSN